MCGDIHISTCTHHLQAKILPMAIKYPERATRKSSKISSIEALDAKPHVPLRWILAMLWFNNFSFTVVPFWQPRKNDFVKRSEFIWFFGEKQNPMVYHKFPTKKTISKKKKKHLKPQAALSPCLARKRWPFRSTWWYRVPGAGWASMRTTSKPPAAGLEMGNKLEGYPLVMSK